MNIPLSESVIYVGERPSELCVVTPFRTLAQHAEEAAYTMKVRTCIAVSDFDNDVEVALEMLRAENVKLLATRGHAVHILRGKASVPVLSIDYSAEIFFETLLPYQNSGMSVGHICFPGQGRHFMKVAKILGLEGHRLEVEDRNNIDSALRTAREKNIELLIGGFGLTSKARERGVYAVPLLSEHREAVYQTFTEAKYILAMDAVNARGRLFVNAVLNTYPNAIVVVDDRYVIKYANDSALKTFNPCFPEIIGLSLEVVFPGVNFDATFYETTGEDKERVLTDTLRREFLFHIDRISLHDTFEGFVISLNNIVEIQKKERKVRQTVYNKTNRPLFSFEDIVGESQAIKRAKQMGIRFAGSDNPVLLVGETGTGKEMFAQAIHARGKRRSEAFVTINCASVPENLLESELFGYEEGAFTGARRGGKTGLFELAHGGTLFLDEIGEMPLQMQSRLLRVLHDKMVMRIGGTRSIPFDVRIICATNRNILNMVDEGKFRADLFYRINTLLLRIPSLGERKEDIALLISSYLKRHARAKQKPIGITHEALEKIQEQHWRGNVRELLHIIDRAIVIKLGNNISPEDIIFDATLIDGGVGGDTTLCQSVFPDSYPEEYAVIRDALRANLYNKGKTAACLGMSRATLWRKMKQYSLGRATP